jgi:predicted MPP superfamily phosphohydrolase
MNDRDALLLLSAATDAALLWALLRRPALDAPRLLRAALWGLAFVLAKGALAVLGLSRGFLGIHVVHTWALVVLPLASLGVLLAAGRRPCTPAARGLAAAGLLLLPLLLAWTAVVEPADLRVERADVPLPAARAPAMPLVVGVLSDLQCNRVGDHERAAVARLMEGRPDLILLPGDLVQPSTHAGFEALVGPVRELLAPLRAPLGAWFVMGNCDWGDGVRRLLEGTPVRVLDNETVRLEHGGREILLGGVDLMFGSRRARDVLAGLEQPGDALRLLVAHRPDVALALPQDTRVDLVVAGHTHGGQVVLPGIGPLVTLSDVPGTVAAGGLHALGGTRVYVSRGVGMERGDAPPIRLNCPPEVTLLTLAGTLAVP